MNVNDTFVFGHGKYFAVSGQVRQREIGLVFQMCWLSDPCQRSSSPVNRNTTFVNFTFESEEEMFT